MLEDILAKRMQAYMAIWLLIPPGLPVRFRRGEFQRKILIDAKLPLTGANKGLVNAILIEHGYKLTRIHGERYYSLSK
jgi:hypothetical protein